LPLLEVACRFAACNRRSKWGPLLRHLERELGVHDLPVRIAKALDNLDQSNRWDLL
jgi:hypothetical protein